MDKMKIREMVRSEINSSITKQSTEIVEEGLVANIGKTWASLIAGGVGAKLGAGGGAIVGSAIAATGLVSPAIIVPAAAVGALGVFVLGARAGWRFADKAISGVFGTDSERIANSLVEIVHKRDDVMTAAAKSDNPEKFTNKIDQLSLQQQKIAKNLKMEVAKEYKNKTISAIEKKTFDEIISKAVEGKLSYL